MSDNTVYEKINSVLRNKALTKDEKQDFIESLKATLEKSILDGILAKPYLNELDHEMIDEIRGNTKDDEVIALLQLARKSIIH